MIHIRIGADVYCFDGEGGELTQVIADRSTRRVTHLVVERKGFGKDERLVPVEQIAETSTKRISLRCSKADLAGMPKLSDRHLEVGKGGVYQSGTIQSFESGSMTPSGPAMVSVEDSNLPEDSKAVMQGMKVEADDGPVGRVYELLVDPDTRVITSLVLVEGRLWRKKAVILPLESVMRVSGDTVYLNLDKQAVAALPSETLDELDRTAIEDQRASVTDRIGKLEKELVTAGQDDLTRLQHELERLRHKQAELGDLLH
jgi:uncharacterized protein YrrD